MFRFAAVVVATFGLTAEAVAGDAVSVELVPKAQAGQGQPKLVIIAHRALRATLDVRRSDGRRFKRASGPLKPGDRHAFALPHARPGRAVFEGRLSIEAGPDQGGQMPIEVETTLLPPLKVEIRAQEVDLARRTAVVRSSRPLKRARVVIIGDAGQTLADQQVEARPRDDGAAEVRWDPTEGVVFRIAVTAYDEDGFFGGVELHPWRVDIPHEEVRFASGSDVIRPSERPKLEASYVQLRGAIAKYGALAKIRLFIAGHTDTVGNDASNRRLSERRARSIGRWFRRRGVRIPIAYAGFGEAVLLVETADETDEARNRRAEYIVAVEAPGMGGRVVQWRSL